MSPTLTPRLTPTLTPRLTPRLTPTLTPTPIPRLTIVVLLLSCLFLASAAAAPASAATGSADGRGETITLMFTGDLRSLSQRVVPRDVAIEFRLYDDSAEGALIWSESHTVNHEPEATASSWARRSPS